MEKRPNEADCSQINRMISGNQVWTFCSYFPINTPPFRTDLIVTQFTDDGFYLFSIITANDLSYSGHFYIRFFINHFVL